MLSCWHEDPNSRPLFKDLLCTVDDLLAQKTGYLEMFEVTDTTIYESLSMGCQLEAKSDQEVLQEDEAVVDDSCADFKKGNDNHNLSDSQTNAHLNLDLTERGLPDGH